MTRPVVGLDPSLTSTGVATEAGQWSIGTAAAGSLIGQLARLRVIAHDVLERVPAGALLVIEAPAFSRFQGGAHARAGLWWMLVDLADARMCTIVQAAPNVLKKFATGNGNASKADMRMALYKRAGIDISNDDAADAWWLRQAGLHILGDRSAVALPKTQLAALGGLRGQLPPAS